MNKPTTKTLNKPTTKPLYKPFVSKVKNKKYSVYVKGENGKPKLISFGDKRYQQFKDKLGHYKHLDHGDTQRKKNYYSRHGKENKKNSAKYFSKKNLL